jgi:small ligand-binding sensory domain FIST
VCASNAQYFDEPALAVMLLDIPCDQYRVFSGVAPLPRVGEGRFVAHTALVHADGNTPDVTGLVAEMAERTTSGYVFGGLAASRGASVQFAVGGSGNLAGHGAAGGVFLGGLSGVAWGPGVHWLSRITQGCQPVGPVQRITAAQDNVVLALDGEPALDVLLRTLDVSLEGDPQIAVERVRATLAGLMDAGEEPGTCARTGHFGPDTRVRQILGLDGARHGVALAESIEPGMWLAFCQCRAAAAHADLTRICAEVREELSPDVLEPFLLGSTAPEQALAVPPQRHITGAIYVSCSTRGGSHWGGPGAELRAVRHALGDVPLVGFFAAGEIAGHHVYGYTGVLTVFTSDDPTI